MTISWMGMYSRDITYQKCQMVCLTQADTTISGYFNGENDDNLVNLGVCNLFGQTNVLNLYLESDGDLESDGTGHNGHDG